MSFAAGMRGLFFDVWTEGIWNDLPSVYLDIADNCNSVSNAVITKMTWYRRTFTVNPAAYLAFVLKLIFTPSDINFHTSFQLLM